MKYSHRYWYVLIFFFFIYGSLVGHSTEVNAGRLSVEVRNYDTNQFEPRVNITVISRNGVAYDIESGNKGEGIFFDLTEGLYSVEVSKAGFDTQIRSSIRILRGKTTELRLALRARIEELLVIGRLSEQKDSFTAPLSQNMDREALRSASGSGGEVMRALDGLPGLSSTGDFASFTVRGRGPDDNLILVDGIPFPGVVHFQESVGASEELEGGRYSVFAPNVIGEAQFQPGGWSVAHSGKAGSFLNLKVARGNRRSGSTSLRIDLAGPELTYDGPSHVFKNTSVLFSYRRLDFGRFFETIGLDNIGAPTLTDLIIKTSTELSLKNEFDVLLIYAPEKYVRDIENVMALDRDNQINDVSLVESEQANHLLGFTWRHFQGAARFENRWYVRQRNKDSIIGEAYLDGFTLDSDPSLIPTNPDLFAQTENETAIGWHSDLRMENAFGPVMLGFRLSQTQADYQIDLKENWVRYIFDRDDYRVNDDQKYLLLEPRFVNAKLQATIRQHALFSEQVFNFESLEIRAGLRVDYIENTTGGAFSETNEVFVSPRLTLTLSLNRATRFHSSVGRFYQYPEILDIARTSRNRAIKSEQTDQISMGLSRQVDQNWSLIAELYRQHLDQLISPADRATGLSENRGEGYSQGLDVVLNRGFGERWSANVSYSYNQSKIDYKDGYGEVVADFQRPHAMSIAGVFELSSRWKISTRIKYYSGEPDDDYIVHENVLGENSLLRYSKEITEKNNRRLNDYSSLNFRVDYQRTFGEINIVAFFDVINALGADNNRRETFNERSGESKVGSGNAFPLIGLRMEF